MSRRLVLGLVLVVVALTILMAVLLSVGGTGALHRIWSG